MTWRVARSLLQLRREVDLLRPGRSTVSDGTIGDADHQTRTSDHNPWVPPPRGGVVTAWDVTNDKGTLSGVLSERLRASRDPRIKYVIANRRIFASYPTAGRAAWIWRPYSGSNPHTTHMHVSVQPDRYDDESPWGIAEEDDVALTSAQEKALAAIPQLAADVADIKASLGGRGIGNDSLRTRLTVRAIAAKLGLETQHDVPAGPVGA